MVRVFLAGRRIDRASALIQSLPPACPMQQELSQSLAFAARLIPPSTIRDRSMARNVPDSDICLILEGTYPYVSGGVSTWVHQIINAFPEWKFSLSLLGAQKDPKATFKYELPKNVVCVEEAYLFQDDGFRVSFGRPGGARSGQLFMQTSAAFPHDAIGRSSSFSDVERDS